MSRLTPDAYVAVFQAQTSQPVKREWLDDQGRACAQEAADMLRLSRRTSNGRLITITVDAADERFVQETSS